MSQFFYVYILQSEIEPEHFYTGLTQDLPKRLRAHNSGRIHHSSKWKPWRLKTYIAFSESVSRRTIRAIFEISVWPRIY
jgi:predicted GIY-YIG superfamily endonuclease